MNAFRIMPAQRLAEMKNLSHTRYGFVIPEHPLGGRIEYPTEYGLKSGDYVASWSTQHIAEMAACALGMPASVVQPVAVLIPEGIEP